jgi:hypothetical protein
MITAAFFTVATWWSQHRYMSMDKWIKKMWQIHTMEYYSAIRRIKFCHLQQNRWNGKSSY